MATFVAYQSKWHDSTYILACSTCWLVCVHNQTSYLDFFSFEGWSFVQFLLYLTGTVYLKSLLQYQLWRCVPAYLYRDIVSHKQSQLSFSPILPTYFIQFSGTPHTLILVVIMMNFTHVIQFYLYSQTYCNNIFILLILATSRWIGSSFFIDQLERYINCENLWQ